MNASTSDVQGQFSNGNAHTYSHLNVIQSNTIETKISKTEDSRSICDNGDFEIVCGISLEDLMDVPLVFQADM